MEDNLSKAIDLALIGKDNNQKEKLLESAEKVLEYVNDVQSRRSKYKFDKKSQSINTMREDKITNEEGKYKDIINQMPESKDNYLKVKKIL